MTKRNNYIEKKFPWLFPFSLYENIAHGLWLNAGDNVIHSLFRHLEQHSSKPRSQEYFRPTICLALSLSPQGEGLSEGESLHATFSHNWETRVSICIRLSPPPSFSVWRQRHLGSKVGLELSSTSGCSD